MHGTHVLFDDWLGYHECQFTWDSPVAGELTCHHKLDVLQYKLAILLIINKCR